MFSNVATNVCLKFYGWVKSKKSDILFRYKVMTAVLCFMVFIQSVMIDHLKHENEKLEFMKFSFMLLRMA